LPKRYIIPVHDENLSFGSLLVAFMSTFKAKSVSEFGYLCSKVSLKPRLKQCSFCPAATATSIALLPPTAYLVRYSFISSFTALSAATTANEY